MTQGLNTKPTRINNEVQIKFVENFIVRMVCYHLLYIYDVMYSIPTSIQIFLINNFYFSKYSTRMTEIDVFPNPYGAYTC